MKNKELTNIQEERLNQVFQLITDQKITFTEVKEMMKTESRPVHLEQIVKKYKKVILFVLSGITIFTNDQIDILINAVKDYIEFNF